MNAETDGQQIGGGEVADGGGEVAGLLLENCWVDVPEISFGNIDPAECESDCERETVVEAQ